MTEVTRGEFDLLRQMVVANQARLENIDDHGTRGIAVLTTQLTEVVKDVTGLQVDLRAHGAQHEKDRQDRVIARRWLIAIGIAGVGALGTVIGILIDLARAVHG